jgi:hypothetical protein
MNAEPHLAMRRRVRAQARRVWQDGVAGDAALRQLFEEVARRPASHPDRDLVPDMAGAGDVDPCA